MNIAVKRKNHDFHGLLHDFHDETGLSGPFFMIRGTPPPFPHADSAGGRARFPFRREEVSCGRR
ncbi:MAG: hypothetical protein IKZ84_07240, partial [Victivallales bacterium]|nr:hypothetical protein [Victivallales bacterium]